MWLESSNAVYGRSRNAYDPWRGVGGSSGGEGALLSAGGAPVGVGADVGGSIRIPAAFNGVFGHKPTGGLIPNTGQFPFTTYPFLTTGPLALSAGDLWPLVQASRGGGGGGKERPPHGPPPPSAGHGRPGRQGPQIGRAHV